MEFSTTGKELKAIRWTPEQLAAYNAVRAEKGAVCPAPVIPVKIAPAPEKPRFKSKSEVAYADLLTACGIDAALAYECLTMRVGEGMRYTPDFSYRDPTNGRRRVDEVKGRHRFREKGVNKLKTAAMLYPDFDFYLCERVNGEWVIKPVRKETA